MCPSAWSQLAHSEKMYAYYLSRAAWEGSKICYFQRSYESPALFVLMQILFSCNMDQYKQRVLERGLTNDAWRQMLAYTAAVFNNCGNYRSFGDTKFVPELNPDDFKTVVRASENYDDYKDIVEEILEKIEFEVFNEEEPFQRIGFRDENNGTTSYYSSNITKDEAKMIDEWCQQLNVSPLNTRLFKIGEKEFELRVASSSVDTKSKFVDQTHTKEDGTKLHVRLCDF